MSDKELGKRVKKKAKLLAELISGDGVLSLYDSNIDMDDPVDFEGIILKAVNKTGHEFTRLEKIAVLEICRNFLPDFSDENVESLVNQIVKEVK